MEFCLEWNKTSLEKANSSHKVRNLWVLSGVFPLNDLQLTEFFEAYTSSAHEIDICGIRIRSLEYSNWALETNMLQEFPINSSFIDIELLCPIEIDNPWTSALRNKRILIIHPFSKSIEKQLLLRKRLFPNSDWLPEAEYSVLQAPQTLSASNSAETWTTNLAKLKQDVSKMEFDIALIGCGAYGLPLGAFIKERGKIAIHVGGALQLYFGIRGLRWDKELKQTIPPECLQYWCWPDKSEIPIESRKVEGGAYWGGQQST
jgi:hypothetical protein